DFHVTGVQTCALPISPILVEDYMCKKLVTFRPDQSILAVMEDFAKYHISGGPVLDDNGFLVGIISEADCMKQISESRYFNQPIRSEERRVGKEYSYR